jgi:parvulin-like peptidyl-prolyl isomerase
VPDRVQSIEQRQEPGRRRRPERFTLSGYIPNVGREPAFAGTAFALNPGQVSKPVGGTRAYYLIKLLEKTAINENDFASQKDTIRSQLLARKQQMMFGQWYTALKEKAKIKDFRKDYL